MAPDKKTQAAARRARIEKMRRAEQARDRRNKILTIAASAVAFAGITGGGWYAVDAVQEKEQAMAAPIQGEKTWEDLSRNHVQKKVDYPMSPAAGGDHNQSWVGCDAQVYSKEVPEENAVHSLEHGAVWVTYNDEASKADIKALREKVSTTPYSFLSPYNEQPSPITLTAWGRQLRVDKPSDPRVGRFLEKYVQGEQTPEPGATCNGGSM